MKIDMIKNYYLYNGELFDVGKTINIEPPVIYEVIRIIDGVALYEMEHIKRMKKSTKLIGYDIKRDMEKISDDIKRLIEKNNVSNLNIKLLCNNFDSEEQDFYTYFIKSNYPSKEIYERGIHTILYNSERDNPNVKIIKDNFRKVINEKLKKEDAFEALLVNEEGYITEGSRSNIFFVKDNKVYTALGKKVLLGITRMKIMEVCKRFNIEVIETDIHENNIDKYDGAFMTGTSVNVLPIATIDSRKYNSVNNNIIRKISEGYLDDMKNYIMSRKSDM
ncbi:aminotransferase class IV [Dethiothermospora halolimnae]|uniref:aminotransferase class IV n=1 Tax=Dethiothermospora halolimnae TaxID=3114390 RepID=UPI003CCB8B3F